MLPLLLGFHIKDYYFVRQAYRVTRIITLKKVVNIYDAEAVVLSGSYVGQPCCAVVMQWFCNFSLILFEHFV